MKRIAILLDYLYIATYQQEVVEGAIAALPDGDTELYFFVGGPFYKDQFNPFVAANNVVYERITKDVFDGIIVCSAVTNYLDLEEASRALERYRGIPIVFIGNAPKGYSRVQTDNRIGMGGVVRHFIADHGYRRIAFAAGKEGNTWAAERFAAYREELEAGGLPFDPALVVYGGFETEHGIEAVRVLLDERRVRFDALIACNDLVALGVKIELEKRGLTVPDDVALAGYDDTVEASCVIPTLTSVRPPYAVIAAKAFALLEELRAGLPPAVHYIPSVPVHRQSCGCLMRTADDSLLACRDASDQSPAAYYAAYKNDCLRKLEALVSPLGFDVRDSGCEACLDSIFKLLTEREENASLFVAVQKVVWMFLTHKMKVESCHDLFSRVRRFFSAICKTRSDMERLEEIFHKVRVSISDVQTIQNFQNLILNWKQTDQVSQVSQDLFGTVESTGLREAIYRSFPVFNIRDFLFVEFPVAGPRGKDGHAGDARVVAFIHAGTGEQHSEDVFFNPDRLFPDSTSAFSSRIRFVLPVTYGENSLGFVIFGKIEREKRFYDARSGGLMGSPYYEKIERLPPLYAPLTRELAKTFYINRLIMMRKSAEESLQQTAGNLEIRNQELEDFTRIASHDLKEPLRKIFFFNERLQSSLAGTISPAELKYSEGMQNAALRMKSLIDGLLVYSRVSTSGEPVVLVDLSALVADVLVDLEILLHETRGKVEVDALPKISADPLQMRELFQNLISNALKYHRDKVPPVVEIKAEAKEDYLEISVSDNGIGFEQQYEEKIFGLFQRLKAKSKSEGTGIGLTICKKIVEKHGGSIKAFGEPGRGATFVIRLPVRSV
ncbi:MAG: substrate-binding domain-containing protein [Spirochaetales bacterium]|nr:substrate-binding domain-containing protein [Spirochaetales bacterium]